MNEDRKEKINNEWTREEETKLSESKLSEHAQTSTKFIPTSMGSRRALQIRKQAAQGYWLANGRTQTAPSAPHNLPLPYLPTCV